MIDLGFGNPDLPSPDIAVAKLQEAAANPRNHRYSSSRGIPKLREAVAARYLRRFGVELDPETGGHQHHRGQGGLLPPDVGAAPAGRRGAGPVAVVPDPHLGPLFAGAEIREIPMGTGEEDFFERVTESFRYSWPRPRVIVLSFPHNPTTTCVDLAFMQRIVDFARENEVVLVHDNAYAEIGFDGFRPPSILQAEGARDVAVELYSMTKSFSMAGWRSAFMVGNPEIVAALAKAQELPGLRRLPAHPDRGHGHPQRGPRLPVEVAATYQSRRDALRDGLNRIGWEVEPPRGTMFVWALIPEPYRDLGSVEFASRLVKEATSRPHPGSGSGRAATATRFALIENEQRIAQGVRNLRRPSPPRVALSRSGSLT